MPFPSIAPLTAFPFPPLSCPPSLPPLTPPPFYHFPLMHFLSSSPPLSHPSPPLFPFFPSSYLTQPIFLHSTILCAISQPHPTSPLRHSLTKPVFLFRSPVSRFPLLVTLVRSVLSQFSILLVSVFAFPFQIPGQYTFSLCLSFYRQLLLLQSIKAMRSYYILQTCM